MESEAGRTTSSKSVGGLIGRLMAVVYALILIGVGLTLAVMGGRLIALGGSLYYLPAGLAAAAAGIAVLLKRWNTGAAIYGLMTLATIGWALGEVGLDGWALAPRVLSPAVLGLPFLVAALAGRGRWRRLSGLGMMALAGALVAAVFVISPYQPVAATRDAGATKPVSIGANGDDWPHFGATQGGARFSPLTQLDRSNVGKLKLAWTTTVGPMPAQPVSKFQAVPVKVGDSVYLCDSFNNVISLDAETGQVRWRHDTKTDTAGLYMPKCRGVAYYAVPAAVGPCATRVYTASQDGRLIALDAQTGALCTGFGVNGQADLLVGIRQRNRGYYNVTSAPTVARGKLVIGGQVDDGQYVGEPSGVIRAFDAVTGKLAWAWDMGAPGKHGEPAAGQFYTSGTPNSWAPMSADDALGLVYVPTGNSTPDYWGGHRSPESNRYASSVVAIDAETGEPRWSFQTTHYDVWDYDVGSQPVLFDLPTAAGPVPALMQATKRGELFVLDRRDGKPLFPVVEKPAPQRGAVERLSPTQPWSVGMPSFGGPPLTERSMWGITAVDQLWCRIQFRESRYDGSMTPPGLTTSISDPGYGGGVDWGSVAIDSRHGLAVLASNRLVIRMRLITRKEADAKRLTANSDEMKGGPAAQEGAPFAVEVGPFLSPLKVPCQAPPHGMLNAVDLRTGRLVWSRPLGDARDIGPAGMASRLRLTVGTPTSGGAMTTASGLTFVGASRDHQLRAFDSQTGELLFSADIPDSSASVPITYRSARSGRQFVVVASDAHGPGGVYGAISAFALPGK